MPAFLPASLGAEPAHNRTRLGATPDADGTDFVVVAPHATAVDLCLIEVDAQGNIAHEQRIGMYGPHSGAWSVYVPKVKIGQHYGYRVYGEWKPDYGLMHNPRKLLLDPYARALGAKPKLSPHIFAHKVDEHYDPDPVPASLSELDSAPYAPIGVVTGKSFPVAPRPRIAPERTIIYETHVKGLTLQLPGVPEDLRGTYAGLAHPTTVNYLKSLGITTIELLPIHAAFDEVFLSKRHLTNYWGYSTLSYFAPEPTYATASAQKRGPQAVLDEVRGMVSILHEAGLEVIMDVVYNHTCESGIYGPSLSLRGFDNLEYYLHTGLYPAQYADVTGTGNTVDFRSTRAVQLTLDSLRYWATDVGIDGFRFDLAVTLGRNASEFSPHHPLLTALATDPVLCDVKLIAEPWDVGPGGWRTGEFPEPFHDWNDRYRDTVRSFWLADIASISKGGTGSDLHDLATRLSGSVDLFSHGDYPGGRGPLGSVNFITAHDGFTLRDLVSYDHKRNTANGEDNRDGTDNNRSWNHGFEGPIPEGIDAEPIEAIRMRSTRNMLGTLLVSAGIPMILGGDELGRTQGGNNNSYCQDSPISWYNWDLEPWQKNLIATTTFLLQLRHQHPVMRPTAFATGQVSKNDSIADLSWFNSDSSPMEPNQWRDPHVRVVQMLRSGYSLADDDLLVIINGTLDQAQVKLPDAHGREWRLVWDSSWDVPEKQTANSDASQCKEQVQETAVNTCAPDQTKPEIASDDPLYWHRDLPGDTTTLNVLSMRIYLSGAPLN